MGLTVKQEKFVQGLFKGLSQRQAYREAYNCDKMKEDTMDNNAYMLTKKSDIKARLTELQNQASDQSCWTVEKLIKEFEELKQLTKDSKDYNVTAKSLENIGKLLGMYETKLKHSGDITISADISEWAK